jgi:hypothetical protein
MSVELEEIDGLDDGEGERDENEEYGGGDEAEARDDGMVSIPPFVISIRVVVIITVKASTTAPGENHDGVKSFNSFRGGTKEGGNN